MVELDYAQLIIAAITVFVPMTAVIIHGLLRNESRLTRLETKMDLLLAKNGIALPERRA